MAPRGSVKFVNVNQGHRNAFLPQQFSLEELVRKQASLLNKIGEKPSSYSEPAYIQFRDQLHELSHHVTLTSTVRPGLVRFELRDVAITDAIDELGLAAQDGNEIDALAVELEASWWLRHPLFVKDLVVADFLVISKAAALRAVSLVRNRVWDRQAFHLAVAIYTEPPLARRKRKDQ